MSERGAPTVPSWHHPDGVHQVMWCADCRAYHWHGRGGGHVWAHCTNPTSRYDEFGYVLDDLGPAPDHVVKDADKKRPKGPAA